MVNRPMGGRKKKLKHSIETREANTLCVRPQAVEMASIPRRYAKATVVAFHTNDPAKQTAVMAADDGKTGGQLPGGCAKTSGQSSSQ